MLILWSCISEILVVKAVFSIQIANTNVIINTHIHSIHTLKIFTSVTTAHQHGGEWEMMHVEFWWGTSWKNAHFTDCPMAGFVLWMFSILLYYQMLLNQ